ncbi:MAG: hypothetical protein COV91_00200 [Candidatus Taylorbacteria bacterium CG11_big_fil_rev_8_21_14_0_20_46_11]|uniref:Uncharacterized protein n=1 Tax=Candidatus Taylorbacteria bacterium CG11_big_fil_rev_8_21_14_0_20_46_11 TaxID=1975025 RepID=A0A2H0KF19_9BACT|nr:MAG: hypothetical protein COV91_00200 [Candidatus Taylorbacteria bacterium CG11_big_fil_rev_8_21_14_0_20_46_11]
MTTIALTLWQGPEPCAQAQGVPVKVLGKKKLISTRTYAIDVIPLKSGIQSHKKRLYTGFQHSLRLLRYCFVAGMTEKGKMRKSYQQKI